MSISRSTPTSSSRRLNTRTGQWGRTAEVLPSAQSPDPSTRLPFIGGELLCESEIKNATGTFRLYGGTHGLVISKEPLKTRIEHPQIGQEVRRVPTSRELLEREAQKTDVR